jgi:hypothetical protein
MAPDESQRARSQGASRARTHQTLTLLLDGITAGDYLQWVRDPDPPNPKHLTLIAARCATLGDRIQLELLVEGEPLSPSLAANAVGFPITADVAAVRGRSEHPRLWQSDLTRRAANVIEDRPGGISCEKWGTNEAGNRQHANTA